MILNLSPFLFFFYNVCSSLKMFNENICVQYTEIISKRRKNSQKVVLRFKNFLYFDVIYNPNSIMLNFFVHKEMDLSIKYI